MNFLLTNIGYCSFKIQSIYYIKYYPKLLEAALLLFT